MTLVIVLAFFKLVAESLQLSFKPSLFVSMRKFRVATFSFLGETNSLTSGFDLVAFRNCSSEAFFDCSLHGLAVLLKNAPIPPICCLFLGT